MDALAWPGAIVVLGFGFFLIFRRPIERLVDRTKEVGKKGLRTFETPQLPAPEEKPDPLAEFLGTYDNRLLRIQENSILEDIKKRGLDDPTAAQKALVRTLAGTQIQLHFERVSSSIWASQINLLGHLNSKADGAALAEVRTFYDTARQQFPPYYENYSFEGWLGFIESFHLVERRGEAVLLSDAGREFLKWRIDMRRTGPLFG